jgi:hypothetical protein
VCMPGWVLEPEKASTGSDWNGTIKEKEKEIQLQKKKGNGKKGSRNWGEMGANERKTETIPPSLFVCIIDGHKCFVPFL